MKRRYTSLKPLVLWRQAERPIDWRRRFGRQAPLEVEIGFGNGEYLVRRARTHPACDFLGIELEWPSTRRALRKIAQENLPNVRLVQAHARVAFERLLLPRSLHRAYALFPSPWPKERNARHRLFSHAFLKLLNSRLQAGGEAQIVTDHRPYLDWVLEQLPGAGFEAGWQAIPARFDTKYERKWQDGGQDHFYELRLIKRAHHDVPLKEDLKLKTYRVPHFDPNRFQPTGERGEVIVEFKEFLYDPGRRKGMARAFVAEEGFEQEIWIQIAHRERAWHIGLARGCGFLPTVAVQRALDLVRDAVQA
jgi:tRNA (guanine-N7-)-methyltransferase